MLRIHRMSELFSSFRFSETGAGSGREDIGNMAQVQQVKPEQPGLMERLNEQAQKDAALAAEKIRVANVRNFIV